MILNIKPPDQIRYTIRICLIFDLKNDFLKGTPEYLQYITSKATYDDITTTMI